MSLNCNTNIYTNILTKFQEILLKFVAITFGCIGIIACLSIFYSIFTSNHFNMNHTNSMIIFLTFSDLMLSATSMTGYTLTNSCDNTSLCIFTSIGTQFFSLSSFLWTCAICHSSYESITKLFINEGRELINSFSTGLSNHSHHNKRKKINHNTTNIVYYHIICWIIPLVSIIIILATNSSGFTVHTCWIVTSSISHSHSLLPLSAAVILYIIPLIIIEVYIIYIFLFLLKTLKQIPFAQALLEKYTRNLSIVIGSKGIFIIYRCILLFLPNTTTFSMIVFVTIVCPLQGIGDYLILKDGLSFRTSDSSHSNYSNDHLTIHSTNGLLRSNDNNDNTIDMNPIIVSNISNNKIIKGYDLVDEDDLVEIEFTELSHTKINVSDDSDNNINRDSDYSVTL